MSESSLYPANKIPVEIKPPTISKLEIELEQLQKLRRVLQSNRIAPYTKDLRQRKIIGICTGCGDIPDFIITRYYEGLQKLERYCAKCIDQTNQNKKRNNDILSSVQVVESVSTYTHNHPAKSYRSPTTTKTGEVQYW